MLNPIDKNQSVADQTEEDPASVFAIKRDIGRREVELQYEISRLRTELWRADISMDPSTKEQLGKEELDRVRYAQYEAGVQKILAEKKAEALALAEEQRAAIAERVQDIHEALTPKDVTPADRLAA